MHHFGAYFPNIGTWEFLAQTKAIFMAFLDLPFLVMSQSIPHLVSFESHGRHKQHQS
jgi:hypothetical protein